MIDIPPFSGINRFAGLIAKRSFRPQLSENFIEREGKSFCIDYVIYRWPEKDDIPAKNRYFKRICTPEPIPLDQRMFKIRLSANYCAYFKEIAPFHLRFDECGRWLKWAKFPTTEGAAIAALTPKDPKTDPRDPSLKRGISGFLHIRDLAEIWDYYMSKLRKAVDPEADVALIPYDNCKIFLGSILGDLDVKK